MFAQRSSTALLLVLLVAAGCSPAAMDEVFRSSGGSEVDRDVRSFVREVDRNVGLTARQAGAVERIVRDRSYRLMETTRPSDRRYVYPFPRRSYRAMNRAQIEFWTRTDAAIERYLPYAASRRYARLTGRDVPYSYGGAYNAAGPYGNWNGRYEPQDDRRHNSRTERRRYDSRSDAAPRGRRTQPRTEARSGDEQGGQRRVAPRTSNRGTRSGDARAETQDDRDVDRAEPRSETGGRGATRGGGAE